MDAKKLEILIKAIDMGSFSKAAESVGYTQSGITHLVNSLEKEIGFRLVNRTFNGISLTKEGEILLPYIRDFLEANDDLSIKIKEIKKNNRCGRFYSIHSGYFYQKNLLAK